MIAYKAQRFTPIDSPRLVLARDAIHLGLLFCCDMRFCLILHHQSVCTQKEEHGHTVMAEERQQVDRQVDVGIRQHLCQPVSVALKELILILLNDRTEPVAVVVQEDADDGKSSQCIACISLLLSFLVSYNIHHEVCRNLQSS